MPIAFGTCGENITWKLSNDGELKIEGTGAMPDYSSDNAPWNDYKEQIKTVVIGSGITHIGNNAFSGCSNLTTVTIPSGVISIGENGFKGCTSITSVTIPASVTNIGSNAFNGCSKLEAVTIPEGSKLTSVGNGAFAGISNNAILTYPNDKDYSSLLPDFKGNKFTITYYTTEGKVHTTQEYYCGQSVIAPENKPTREGYEFKGWHPELPKTMPAENITVTAQWQVKSFTLKYIVDGEEYNTFTVEFGKTLTPIDYPTKTGYNFSGWSELPETMPAKDVTVTGSFTVNQYTITFDTNGGTAVDPITLDYNTAVTALDEPTKEGYTFIGWSPKLPETMPAENIIVTAQWKYTPIIVDGTEYSVTENKHAESITYTRTLSKANVWNALYVPFEIPVTEEFLQNYDVAYFNDIHSYDDYIGDKENGVKGKDGEIDGMEMELLRVQQGQILNANYPYLIRAKNENALDMELKVEDATLYRTVETTVSCSSVFMRFDVTGIYTTQTSGELKGEFNVYAMSGGGWKMALSDSQQLKPFRLYLKLTTIAGSPVKVSKSAMKAISIRVDGEEGTTTIDNTELTIGNAEDVVYDLQGRRVANPGKGMYIVNGKKVIFK